MVDPGSTTFGVHALSFSLYAHVYQQRPDIHCLIHVQTPAATAVSAMKCGLLSLCQEALICGRPSTHSINIDLHTNQLSLENNVQQSTAQVNSAAFVASSISASSLVKVLILPNYGILACGTTVEEAWHIAFHLILACESQLRMVSVGLDNLYMPSEESRTQVIDFLSMVSVTWYSFV